MAGVASTADGVAVIGGGNLGEALLTGLLRAGFRTPGQVALVELDQARARRLRDTPGLTLARDAGQAADRARTLVLAIKPYQVDAVLADLAGRVTEDHLIVSVVGGVPIERIEKGLGVAAAVVRCMPNTAIGVGAGVTAISPGAGVDPHEVELVRGLFESVGDVVQVPQTQLDAVTALSGSGPAYLLLVAEALTDAGVLLGLPRPLSEWLVDRTVAGAGTLLRESSDDAVRLRAAVSSPGGTTVAALRQLEERGVRAAMIAAAEAARDRSVELSRWEGQ
ncbi:pyrroline-5-carboxylate reductase [Actinoplanes sp. NPDC051411]|uniref:pyrroline-5-carboxylate reductase n=1 Tax=Actinoplanes sp. NPDC051411 TaxID=3155522 RepID=UPI003441E95E